MNKLEEQLRASRRTEVPGLKPPPGGWEAISGKLANGAAGASSTAGTGSGTGSSATAGNGVAAGSATASGSTAAAIGTKALVLKWIAGLGTALLVGGGITYAVISRSNPTTETPAMAPATNQATTEITPKAAASPADQATAGPEIIEATPKKVTEVRTDATSSPAPNPKTGPLSAEQPTSRNPLPAKAQAAEPPTQRTVAPAKPATGSRNVPPATKTTTPSTKVDNDNVKKYPPTEDPTTENIPLNTPPTTQAVTPGQSPLVRSTVPAPLPEQTTNEETIPTFEKSPTVIPTDDPDADASGQLQSTLSQKDLVSQAPTSAVVRPDLAIAKADALPTEAPNSGIALLPRLVSPLPLTPALLFSSFTSPVATPPKFDLPKFGRNGKRRAPAYWEYHGSLSAYYYQNYKRSAYYERQPGTGPFTFVLPTGETIRATTALSLSDETPSLEQGFYLKGGIDRQTSSGFLFRLSAGLSFFDERKNDDNFNLVSDNLIREDQKAVEWSLPVEMGVQYTFLKRHRLRPYLGVSMIGTLFHHSVQEATFFDGRTMLSGTSERTVNSFFFGGLRDIGLEAGIQYRLNNLWSVGILTRVSSDFHVYIPAAFGVEVRYSLK